MVDITIRDGELLVEPRGWSKLWTLRGRLAVPLAAVRSVRRAPPAGDLWIGWRLPGTYLPGVITAGSYYRKGEWTFWDVRGDGESAIEVQLSGTRYDRLMVDVDDPDAMVSRLLAAAKGPSGR